MHNQVTCDVIIFGGGVAGLWLLNQLRRQGYTAILLETATIGGAQTHKAQGIIHGGLKYALQGTMTPAAEAISAMPTRWQNCLQGQGDVDLRGVSVLSQQQHLWTTGGIASRFAGFFARLALQGGVSALTPDSFPAPFDHADFKGQVYALNEVVIDVHSLLHVLVAAQRDAIFKIDPLTADQILLDSAGDIASIAICSEGGLPVRLSAKKFVLAAGSGNAFFLDKLHTHQVQMQRRPLHMVLAKKANFAPLYAHCLGWGAAPRVTVTTHWAHDGKPVWYIGGHVAEEGVGHESGKQIDSARRELRQLLPWVDLANVEFATFHIDRAEPLQAGGKRPDTCYFENRGNAIVAWPTKLAFSPLLAEQVMVSLEQEGILPGSAPEHLAPLVDWPKPAIAVPIWDQLL